MLGTILDLHVAQTLMVEETLKKRLEFLAQTIAVVVLVIYASGFVALAAYHSSFGIVQLNLWRPKILTAGVLVCVFLGLPVIETLRLPQVKEFFSIVDTPKKWSATARMVPWLFLTMTVSGLFIRQLFVGSWLAPGTHIVWGLWGVLPFLLVIAALDTWPFPMYLKVLGVLLTFDWLVFCFYRTRDKTLWFVIGWFLWCAFITLQAYGPLTSLEKLRTVNVLQTLVTTVATFGFFGLWIYGRIPVMLMGGGACTRNDFFQGTG
jgi:hypothetical protein